MGNNLNHISGYGESKKAALESFICCFEYNYGKGAWNLHKDTRRNKIGDILEKEYYLNFNNSIYQIYYVKQNDLWCCYAIN